MSGGDGFDAAMDAYSLEADSEPLPDSWDEEERDERTQQTVDALSARLDELEARILTEDDSTRRVALEDEYDRTFRDWESYSGSVAGDWLDAGGNDAVLARMEEIRQADRPAGTEHDPAWIPRPRREELRSGRPPTIDDAATARNLIREAAEAKGLDVGELLRRPPRGRPTPDERRRKQALAGILLELRQGGATIATLAAASSRSVATVHQLLSAAKAPAS